MAHGTRVSFVPLATIVVLWLVPSTEAGHLSMAMPGLGGAVVPGPSVELWAITTLAALVQGALLSGPEGRLRELGWAGALAPLTLSAGRALSVSVAGSLEARIAEVGGAGSEQMWALLGALALTVGFGAARVIDDYGSGRRADARRPPSRFARAGVVLLLTLPFVALVLTTSTGLDAISAWIRWSGCGAAALVCAGSALVPHRRREARVIGGITFTSAVVLALLAQREYVEALGHDVLVHHDPFDPGLEWARGLGQIADAVEPRERYGLVTALLPWIALAPGARWRHAALREAAALVALVLVTLVGARISSRLDAIARDAVDTATVDVHRERDEIRWAIRVLPRTAPWLRAMEAAPSPAGWLCARPGDPPCDRSLEGGRT